MKDPGRKDSTKKSVLSKYLGDEPVRKRKSDSGSGSYRDRYYSMMPSKPDTVAQVPTDTKPTEPTPAAYDTLRSPGTPQMPDTLRSAQQESTSTPMAAPVPAKEDLKRDQYGYFDAQKDAWNTGVQTAKEDIGTAADVMSLMAKKAQAVASDDPYAVFTSGYYADQKQAPGFDPDKREVLRQNTEYQIQQRLRQAVDKQKARMSQEDYERLNSYMGELDWSDAVTNPARFIRNSTLVLTQSLPAMAASIGIGAVASTLLGPVGGMIAAGGAYAPQFIGEGFTDAAQDEEGNYRNVTPEQRATLVGTGVLRAGVESAAERFIPGVGKVLGKVGGKTTTEAAQAVINANKKVASEMAPLWKRFPKEVGQGAVAEALGEGGGEIVGQLGQVAVGAKESVDFREVATGAVYGAGSGGMLGGVGSVYNPKTSAREHFGELINEDIKVNSVVNDNDGNVVQIVYDNGTSKELDPGVIKLPEGKQAAAVIPLKDGNVVVQYQDGIYELWDLEGGVRMEAGQTDPSDPVTQQPTQPPQVVATGFKQSGEEVEIIGYDTQADIAYLADGTTAPMSSLQNVTTSAPGQTVMVEGEQATIISTGEDGSMVVEYADGAIETIDAQGNITPEGRFGTMGFTEGPFEGSVTDEATGITIDDKGESMPVEEAQTEEVRFNKLVDSTMENVEQIDSIESAFIFGLGYKGKTVVRDISSNKRQIELAKLEIEEAKANGDLEAEAAAKKKQIMLKRQQLRLEELKEKIWDKAAELGFEGDNPALWDQTIRQAAMDNGTIPQDPVATQPSTLDESVGRKVTYNGKTGTMKVDNEGNYIVDTGDTEFEIPSSKDGTKPISEYGIELAPERNARIDEGGNVVIDEVRPDQSSESANYTFVSEGKNQEGGVVSVTLKNDKGQNVTIREPKIVEQIVFGMNERKMQQTPQEGVTKDTELEGDIEEMTSSQADEAGTYGAKVMADSPIANIILDKIEAGMPLEDGDINGFDAFIENALTKVESSNLTRQQKDRVVDMLSAFETEVAEYYETGQVTTQPEAPSQPTPAKPDNVVTNINEGKIEVPAAPTGGQVSGDPKGDGTTAPQPTVNPTTTEQPKPQPEPAPQPVAQPEPLSTQGENLNTQPTTETPQPIRQLGTGANVYFETDKYRVNDSKDGVLLNVTEQGESTTVTNIKFDNLAEAVRVAEEINKNLPNGVPPGLDVEKYIKQLRGELSQPSPQPVAQPEPAPVTPKPDAPKPQQEQPVFESIPGSGKEVTIDFNPDGSKRVTGRFAVIEAKDLQPSHNNDGRVNMSHRISRAQPRDRGEESIKGQPTKIAQTLNPALITAAPDPFHGSPVVTHDNMAIQGNGRSIALKTAWAEVPQKAQEYKQYLIDNAESFGIDPAIIEGMEAPILVRQVAVSDAEAIELGNITNQFEAETSKRDKAKAIVRKLTDEKKQLIGEILASSDEESLRAILDQVGDRLIKQIPDFGSIGTFDKDGSLTTKSKEMLEEVLIGLIIDNEDAPNALSAYENMPSSVRNAIEKNLPSILNRLGKPGDLSPVLRKAIEIIGDFNKNKDQHGTIDAYLRQGDMLEGYVYQGYAADATSMAKALYFLSSGTKVAKKFGDYFDNIYRRMEGYADIFETVEGYGYGPEQRAKAIIDTLPDQRFGPIEGQSFATGMDQSGTSQVQRPVSGGEATVRNEQGDTRGEREGNETGETGQDDTQTPVQDRPEPGPGGTVRGMADGRDDSRPGLGQDGNTDSKPEEPPAPPSAPAIEEKSKTKGGRPPLLYAVSKEQAPKPDDVVTEGEYPMDEDQRYGVNMALTAFNKGKKAFLLADGTGVGKTRQILAIADKARKQGMKVLIVSENTTILEENFRKDAEAMGIDTKPLGMLTYSAIREGKADSSYDLVIFDEAHNLKNPTSLQAMAVAALKVKHRLYATATPMDTVASSVYFIAETTGVSTEEAYQSLGFRLVRNEAGEVTGVTIQEGMSFKDIRDNILHLRDKMIKEGTMLRREYPFYGKVDKVMTPVTKTVRDEETRIISHWEDVEEDAKNDNGFVPRKKLMSIRGQRSGELSRHNESRKVDYVFQMAMQDIKDGKSVVIIAEGINDSEIKGLDGEVVPGFIQAIEKKFAQAGIKTAGIYGSKKGDKVKANRAFQSGEVQVVIGTPKSASTGIDLDDQAGGRPRKLYMVTPNYSGNVFDQILGRVSRRNTKSEAEVELVFNDSVSDARREQIVNKKLETLRAIQRGDLEETLFDDGNITTEAEETSAENESQSNNTSPTGTTKPKVGFTKISDKAFVVTGDTYPIREKLKSLGGKWHGGKKAWMFPTSRMEEISRELGGNIPRLKRQEQPFLQSVRPNAVATNVKVQDGKVATRALKKQIKELGLSDIVTVYDSPQDVPTELLEVLDMLGGINEDGTFNVEGMYVPGDKAHVFGWMHKSPQAVQRTFLHEVVGHMGLRKLFSDKYGNQATKEFNAFLSEVIDFFKGSDIYNKIVRQYDINEGDPDHQRLLGEELVAFMAENDPTNSLIDKLIVLIRKALKAAGMDIKLSRKDLVGIIAESKRAVGLMKGGKREMLVTRGDVNFARPTDFSVDNNGNISGLNPESIAEIVAERANIEAVSKKDGTWLKAPNGKPTNLNEEQWVTVRTERFKDWFGDWEKDTKNASKVIDDNGEPMVVYHGTNADFTIFDRSKQSWETRLSKQGPGFYFTNILKEASAYGKVITGFLSVKNPITLSIRGRKISRKQAIELVARGNYDWFFTDWVPFYTGTKDVKNLSKKEIATIFVDYIEQRHKDKNFDLYFLQEIKRAYRDQEGGFDLMLDNLIGITGYDGAIEQTSPSRNLSVFTAFSPNQIKSATSNKGTFSGLDDIRLSKALDRQLINGFYSPLEEIIENTKQDKMPAKQWAEKFARGEEAKWTGLSDWLASQTGSVSKKDILDFLKENRIEIKNIERTPEPSEELIQKEYELESNINTQLLSTFETLPMDKQESVYNKIFKQDNEVYDPEYPQDAYTYLEREFDYDLNNQAESNQTNVRAFHAMREVGLDNLGLGQMLNELGEINSDVRNSRSKYSSYILSGQLENYKEILVTLPQKTRKHELEIYKQGDGLYPWKVRLKGEKEHQSSYKTKEEAEEFVARNDNSFTTKTGPKFQSNHFDEQNILAHIRTNIRTDADGKKVLFIEEIQSDWAQKGREGGFITQDVDKKLKTIGKQVQDARIEWNEAYTAQEDYYIDNGVKKGLLKKELASSDKVYADLLDNFNSIDTNLAELKKNEQALLRSKVGVPQAPFVANTSSWVKIAIKTALKEAVAKGVDKIAWTTGSQQNDRYSLAKVVDEIRWSNQVTTGDAFVEIDTIGHGMMKYAVNRDSRLIVNTLAGEDFVGKTIDEIIGKGISDEIVSNKWGRKNGDGLRLESKGMVGFYDKIVPDVAKATVKQITGKEPSIITANLPLQKQDVKIGEQFDISDAPAEVQEIIMKYANEDESIDNTVALEQELAPLGYEIDFDMDGTIGSITRVSGRPTLSPQQAIEITPEIKQSVMEGIPLFKKASEPNPSPQVRFRKGVTITGATPPDLLKARSDWFVRNFQDRHMDSAKMLKQKRKEGTQIESYQDFMAYERVRVGRIDHQMEMFQESFETKIVNALQGVYDAGLSYIQAQDYLIALHAPERNATLKDAYGVENGSGVTDQEAADFIASLTPEEIQALDVLADAVHKTTQFTLDAWLDGGLITRMRYDMLKSGWTKYVPLRGLRDLMPQDLMDLEPEDDLTKSQFNTDPTKFSDDKSAFGRTTKAGDVIAYSINMAKSAIVKKEQNRVKQAMFNLMRDHPDTKRYKIRSIYYIDTGTLDSEGNPIYVTQFTRPTEAQRNAGVVKTSSQITPQANILFSHDKNKNSLVVLIEGKPYVMEFANSHIPTVFKNMDVGKMSDIVAFAHKAISYLRNFYTTYSPEFVVRNLIRDVETGSIHVYQDFGAVAATKVTNPVRLGLAMRGLKKWIRRRDTSSEWGMWSREFFAQGGATGYYDMDTVDIKTRNLLKEMHKPKWKNSAAPIKALGQLVSDYNKIVENAMRVSTYRFLVEEKGWSKVKAAEYAKNLTVDFNRKGSKSSGFGSLYLFFNAAVQGTFRMFQGLASDNKWTRVRSVTSLGLLTVNGMLINELSRFLLGDDDDERDILSKYPEYTRRTNVVAPNFVTDKEGDVLLLPLPYGHNVFFYAGVLASDLMHKQTSPLEAAFSLAEASMDSFSPMGGFDSSDPAVSLVKIISPTIIKPLVDIAFNRDFADNPINPDQLPYNRQIPDAYNYFRGTGKSYVATAQAIGNATGGDQIEPGAIDLSPGTLEHLVVAYTGTMGRTLSKTLNSSIAVMDAVSGKYLDSYRTRMNVPFASIFTRELSPEQPYYDFRSNMRKVREAEQKFNAYIESGETKKEGKEKARKYAQDMLGLPALSDLAVDYSGKIKKRKDRETQLKSEIEGLRKGTPEYDEAIKKLEETRQGIKSLSDKFNRYVAFPEASPQRRKYIK